jgi:hypothetical protein
LLALYCQIRCRQELTGLGFPPGLGHTFVVVGEARSLALFEELDHAGRAKLRPGQVFELLALLELSEVAEEIWQIIVSA